MILKDYFKSIDRKFPEVGHTYLDSDRDFGRIEKEMRHHPHAYLLEEYRPIIIQASKGNHVIVTEPHFRDIDNLASSLKLTNRKKGYAW